MPYVHLLGTGAAWTDPHRTTTMLAFSDDDSTWLIDCGGDAVQRMLSCDLPLERLKGMILTHEHADHVSGFPLFIERIWLGGRRSPVPVYGLRPTLDQARRCWEAFDTRTWKDVPEMRYTEVAHEAGARVLEDDTWRVTSAPVVHPVPIIGLRVEHKPTGRVFAYSADTEPAEAVVELARGAQLLVHEATGEGPGHTSAAGAARIAARAGVSRLVLVHLPPGIRDGDLAEARLHCRDVALGDELGRYTF